MTTSNIDRSKKVSKINTWKPKEDEVIVSYDGKIFICDFPKVFGHKDKLENYKKFRIKKESYANQLDTITSYINFFINNYDFDNELVSAYLSIKYALDKKKKFTEKNMKAYIDFLYEILFTDSILDKIIQMVEENYLDDIETTTEEKKKYLKNDKKHRESLEFTNQHIKILLEISFGMKIMAPAIFHYFSLNDIKIEKDSEVIFKFYKRLFDLFGYNVTYELCHDNGDVIEEDLDENYVMGIVNNLGIEPLVIGRDKYYYFEENGKKYYYTKSKINMYNKLYVYIKAKVVESNTNNAPIFKQREIFGVDVFSVINQFTKKVLISENMVKYKFNEIWDSKQKKYKENVIGLAL